MLTISEINTAIITGSLSDADLLSIGDAIRFVRAQLVRKATGSLTIGRQVKFTNSRTGVEVTGKVKKVNRKFIIVDTGAMTWRVPGNMLTAV